MANPDTAEAAESAASAVEERIKELLAPLLSDHDQLLSEEAEIQASLNVKKAERKSVERVLRSSALISSDSKPKAKPKASIAPSLGASKPRTKQAQKAQEKILETIRSMEGKPFQLGMIERRSGAARGTIERVIGVMRGQDRLRLLGSQPQIERSPNAPGGRPAITFQEIS